MDLNQIKQDIADLAMAGTSGDYKITATPFWPGSPMAPCLAPGEQEIQYGVDMGDAVDITMTWRLAVGRTEEEAGQALLDTYLSTGSANSIIDAINGDDRFAVESGDAYRLFEWAGSVYYGAELAVQVLA